MLTLRPAIQYPIGSTRRAAGSARRRCRNAMAEDTARETSPIELSLDSRLESADAAEELAIRVAREAGFSEEEQHRFGMAVRETVVNAVVHGNRYNARKKVYLRIAADKDRLTVTVTDEGEGFQVENLPNPVTEENILQQSGRGIFLVRAFVDEFRVRRAAPKGAEVTLVKYRRRD
jgi:serine/threonine-protein kinase RsbW